MHLLLPLNITDLWPVVLLNLSLDWSCLCRYRQQARYDAMDHDIVQGAEDQGIQEEEGGGETS